MNIGKLEKNAKKFGIPGKVKYLSGVIYEGKYVGIVITVTHSPELLTKRTFTQKYCWLRLPKKF